MTDPYPDIEIYIKNPSREHILDWLSNTFTIAETRNHGSTTHFLLDWEGRPIRCVIVKDAVKKGRYTSVWFQSDASPWTTDRDCALAAHQYLGREIRCASTPWVPDQREDCWLCIDTSGERMISWQS